ncbi:hypothetical protein PCK1_001022 [Pneumocystis canis]|nr:hypothetical protein PCK1_001022 [Pneumocystis canis]
MLKKRDLGALGEVIGEEEFLAFILKEKVNKAECENKLEKYCKSLKNAELTSEKVHEKLKGVCEDGKIKDEKNKCKRLEENIKNKCTKFKNELETALKESFTEKNCSEYEQKCLFLGACLEDVTEKCSKLRNRCYLMKRMNIADEIALRVLKGNLKKEKGKEPKNQCKEKLGEHCPILSKMSQELMEKCLDSEKACQSLITEAEKKCASLKTEAEKAVKDVNNKTCLLLLKECYFYGPNCEDEIQKNCEKLKTKCEDEHDIIYIPPEEPWFPIQPMPDITDKVGLEKLYNEAAKLGLLIEGLRTSMDDLILYLSQKSGDERFDAGECEKQKDNCEYLKKLSGDSTYNCTNIDKECKRLEDELQRGNLEERIQKIKLFDGNKSPGNAKTIPWHKLNSDIYGRNCAQLQSDCFFLTRYKNDLTPACENIQAMCYKRGLDTAAYEILESKMRGFRDSEQDGFQKWSKKCQKKLIEVCKGVRNQSYHLLALCLEPKETCSSLSDDILDKTYELNHILGFTRDSPEKHDCLKLEPKTTLSYIEKKLLSSQRIKRNTGNFIG